MLNCHLVHLSTAQKTSLQHGKCSNFHNIDSRMMKFAGKVDGGLVYNIFQFGPQRSRSRCDLWTLRIFRPNVTKIHHFQMPGVRSRCECRIKILPIHKILDLDLSISSFGIGKRVRGGVRVRPRTRVAKTHFQVYWAKVPLKFVAQR